MKVLQVVPSIGVESSGPSYSVPGLCRGLTANGVDVSLHFLGNRPSQLQGVPYDVQSYPRHDKFNLGYSSEMLKGLREACRTADIIHNNSLWMMPNVYPVRAVKGTNCKLVVAPRGTLAAWSLKKGWLKKKIFGWLLQNRVLRQADMFHATSEKEYEEIRAAGYKQPVAIVPIGMDIPDVSQFVSNSNTLNSKTQTLRQVVFFGRLHKVKAVDRLVQAWELLNQSNNPNNRTIEQWELVIAGPDNGIRGELEKYIAEHKIPRVRFVGEINGLAKYEFLSAADLYVLPSHTENFGVTVAEALACGTPVIVSKGTPWQGVEGEKEVVVESGSGTVEEREGRGARSRSTVEFGSPAISRRLLAEKKVDEWLRGVTRESFVSALGKLVEEKTAAGEYCFRRSEERGLALKGAARFYDEFSRKIIPLSDGRCVYFTPDARSKVRNGNDLSRCWAEYAFHAVSNGGRRIAGKEYNERWYHPHKASNFSQIVQTVTKERCYVRLRDNSRNDSILFYGEVVSGLSFDVVTRLDEFGNIGANLTEVTVEVSSRGEKKPPRLVPLTEAVQTVVHHQTTAGSYPSDTCNISNSLGLRNGLPFAAEAEGRGRDTGSAADGGDLDPEALASNENTESHHCRPRISTSTSSRCGWWVENDPETLAKTLREAMSLSEEERRRMGEVGRDWIRRDFSWEGVGAKMKAAYEWLLNGGETPEWVKLR